MARSDRTTVGPTEGDGSGSSPIPHGQVPITRVASVTAAAAARFARLPRPSRIRLRRRHALLLVGLGLSMAASSQAEAHGIGLVPVILFAIAPRMPILLGIRQPKAPGGVARRVVPLFNAMHEPLLPLAIVGLGMAGVLPALWLVGALAWLGQLVIDWGLGDGLRAADGTLRPAPARWTSWPGGARSVGEGARA